MKVLCVDDIKHVKTNEVADKPVSPHIKIQVRERAEKTRRELVRRWDENDYSPGVITQ